MKKLVSLVMMLAMMLAITPLESSAQASKSSIKAAKTRAKELKKDGWICEGPQSLESAFIDMANKEAQGYRFVTGSASGRDIRVASIAAQHDAMKKISDSDTEGTKSNNTQEKTEAGTVSLTDLSALKPSPFLTIFRNDPSNHKCECQIFFLIPPTTKE